MKKDLALEWLKASYSDIIVLDSIVGNEVITHMTAFHAQQSVEKSLKAILEYHEAVVPKKHDILMIKDKVSGFITINNEDILEDLNSLYIESRYPGDIGLLPHGKPTLDDARGFYEFAKSIFYRVCKLLEIDPKEVKK